MANAVNNAVSDYWSTVTGGAVSFVATAYPTAVTTTTTPCANNALSDPWAFWDEVAAKTGWTQGAGKHLVVYFEKLAACGGTAGLGTLGNGVASGGMVWTNGHTSTGVLGHELGHNLGLGHSQELDCSLAGTRIMDAPAASCVARSYWDTHDIMAVSWWNQGFLNASHLRRLGVLEPGAETTPAASGQVTLAPLAGATGRRVLTLSDGATRYVVEYRAATGLDAWMATDPGWGAPGVTVRREFDPASVPAGMSFPLHASYLLDGDPAHGRPLLRTAQRAAARRHVDGPRRRSPRRARGLAERLRRRDRLPHRCRCALDPGHVGDRPGVGHRRQHAARLRRASARCPPRAAR